MAKIQRIIQLYTDGMIRLPELNARLDLLQVRGGWENGIYTGFDYANQRWFRFNHRGEQVAA